MQAVEALPNSHEAEVRFSQTAQFLFLLGGLALIVGPSMPWLELFGPTIFSASGLERTGGEAIIIVALGGAVGLSALISLWRERDQTMMVPFFFGLSAGLMALVYWSNLRSAILHFESSQFSVGVGSGLYVCLAGGLMVSLGLFVAHRQSSALSSGHRSQATVQPQR